MAIRSGQLVIVPGSECTLFQFLESGEWIETTRTMLEDGTWSEPVVQRASYPLPLTSTLP